MELESKFLVGELNLVVAHLPAGEAKIGVEVASLHVLHGDGLGDCNLSCRFRLSREVGKAGEKRFEGWLVLVADRDGGG